MAALSRGPKFRNESRTSIATTKTAECQNYTILGMIDGDNLLHISTAKCTEMVIIGKSRVIEVEQKSK